MMDTDDFRSILESSGVDVWTFIDTAIHVASMDYGSELKRRRDEIVERLFAASSSSSSCNRCRNCDFDVNNNGSIEIKACAEKERTRRHEAKQQVTGPSPSPTRSIDGHDDDDDDRGHGRDNEEEEEEEEEELDPYGGLFDDEQKKILEIKQHLEDPDQSEDSLVDLLQSLADMDVTFTALKETDIGRHVNHLRKHSSSDVRRLVKLLIRKWKEIVDEWVRLNPEGQHASSALMADGDSPQQKIPQNGHHQVPDFAYSPNPHNGSSGSDKNNSETERKPKPVPRRETPSKPTPKSAPPSLSSQHNVQRQREQQKQSNFESERLASARRRLQENYKEAENAKKQRTIQVMDIHEIPKPKNAFFAKNRGGGSQGRHW